MKRATILEGASVTLRVGSPAAMRRVGLALGELLMAGDFVGLSGELGAGKTVLARGIAEGAGVPAGEVASPSFAIIYTYRGRLTLLHADLYRVSGGDELHATGFYDLLPQAAAVVEWIERLPEARPAESLLIELSVETAKVRRLHLIPRGARHTALAARLLEKQPWKR